MFRVDCSSRSTSCALRREQTCYNPTGPTIQHWRCWCLIFGLKLWLLGMINRLSLTLLIVFDDTLTRKILIFYEFYACISIVNAVYRQKGIGAGWGVGIRVVLERVRMNGGWCNEKFRGGYGCILLIVSGIGCWCGAGVSNQAEGRGGANAEVGDLISCVILREKMKYLLDSGGKK